MSTSAQIAANIANAQHSTGARTPEGKAIASKNSIVFGLFSGDFIRPGEESDYATLEDALHRELEPAGVLETVLAGEMHRALWRLRRCGKVEADLVLFLTGEDSFILDPMECGNPRVEKIQHSVDRARSQAHRLLHKATAELRKLQAERRKNETPERVETRNNHFDRQIPVAQRTQSEPSGTARNAPCPCGSGEKHKRCCGKNAPPVLFAA